VLLEELGQLKKKSYEMGNQTRDLPACSIVPQNDYATACLFEKSEFILRAPKGTYPHLPEKFSAENYVASRYGVSVNLCYCFDKAELAKIRRQGGEIVF
jgi:hypothetical protein